MSLDVYLTGPEFDKPCECDCGHKHTHRTSEKLYRANITHNLGKMAIEAGIYEYCWRPGEVGVTKAKQLIEPLLDGIELMESDPKRFKEFDPSNGWGTYDNFIPWLRNYLEACQRYPDSNVNACR